MTVTHSILKAVVVPTQSPKKNTLVVDLDTSSSLDSHTDEITLDAKMFEEDSVSSNSEDPEAARHSPKGAIFGRSWAFYCTYLLLEVIWLLVPLSFIVIGVSIFKLIRHRHLPIIWCILAAFAVVEVTFAIYQQYLIWRAKRWVTVPTLAAEDRLNTSHDVFHANLRGLLPMKDGHSGYIVGTGGDVPERDSASGLFGRSPALERQCEAVCCRSGSSARVSETEAQCFRRNYGVWFNNAEWEDLRRDNVLDLLSWMVFGHSLKTTWQQGQEEELEKIFVIFQARSGSNFPLGPNPAIRVSKLTLDPLIAISRPMILYTVNNTANFVLRNLVLPSMGMRHLVEGDIEYLLRIPAGWTPEKGRCQSDSMPIMYLHGLGFGLIQNFNPLKPMLKQLPTHPILFPIAHHTTQAIYHRNHLKPWSRTSFTRDIKAICERWGFGQGSSGADEKAGGMSVISHSNGSVHHAWLIKDCPELIRRHTFIDPIVFTLTEGYTCHAFCYRKPTTLILQRLLATEVGISNYIQRHFHWSDNFLFIENHAFLLDPAIAQVHLSKNDQIVNAPRVREYLESHGLEVGVGLHWDADGGHGSALKGQSLGKVLHFARGEPRYGSTTL